MPSEKSPPYSSLATEKRDFPPTPINIAFQGSKATKRLPQCGDGGGEAWELMQINLRKGFKYIARLKEDVWEFSML